MEELYQMIENVSMVADKIGMTAEEFVKFLHELATAEVVISENDIRRNDKGDIEITVAKTSTPIKLVIEEERWDWLDDTDN